MRPTHTSAQLRRAACHVHGDTGSGKRWYTRRTDFELKDPSYRSCTVQNVESGPCVLPHNSALPYLPHSLERPPGLSHATLYLRAESGGIVLATAYWATSSQGGVTRQGVVLTYLLSIVIGSQ